MKISDSTREMIKGFEGLRLEAYQCSAYKWTIGWGHTEGVEEGNKISEPDAERLFIEDIRTVERELNGVLDKITLNQNQFDSLASFVFNIGIGKFVRSTMYKLLTLGCIDQAGYELGKWIYAGGKKNEGLIKRRKVEMDLYFTKT